MKSYTSIHNPKDLLTYEFLTKSLGVKKYDETATYSKGALVYHEDATDTYLDSIFEANQDIATAESWTPAHWDTVDLETIIKRSIHKAKEYMEVFSGTAPITGFTVDANGVLSFTRSSIEYVTHIDKSVIFTSSNTFNLQLDGNAWHGDGTLEYSTDGYTWETYGTTNATTLPAPKLQDNGKYELYLRGKGNTTTISGGTTKFTTDAADRINVMGSLDTLLNYTSTPVTTSIKSLFEGANIVDASNLVMPTNYNSAENSHCAMLFKSCVYLTGAPQFPNVTLANQCYSYMFQGCTALTTAPALPATTVANQCYSYMFQGCTSLTTAPALPATTVDTCCYSYMFEGCESLTTAPALPATTVANQCYSYMFQGCTSLTTPPALPATTLANQCYSYMFQGCTSLTTPPTLPATTVANQCYSYMFEGCESLTTPPTLPATTVGEQGYEYMFQNCTALTAAPALPATTLNQQCYESMFKGCTGITKIPALPATTIPVYGYRNMFEGCTGLKFYPVSTKTTESFTIPSTTTVGTDALQYMFKDCTNFPEAGGTPVPGTVYGYGDKISNPYITIESIDNTVNFGIMMMTGVPDVDLTNLEWSIDGTNWKEPAEAGGPGVVAFPVAESGEPIYVNKVYVRGNGFTHFADKDGYVMTMYSTPGGLLTESVIKISGELRYLYDKSGEATCGNASMLFAPAYMGVQQAVISDVSELVFPTKLNTEDENGLFTYMFTLPGNMSCQPITQPPQLPATELAPWCYYRTFCGCTLLATAPELPALTIPSGAYVGMFDGCTSLTTPPTTLPATTLEIDNAQEIEEKGDGYEWMFYNCPLTTIPTMPASITINRTGEYAVTSPLAFYQMFKAGTPSLDFAGTTKSWICPTIDDESGAVNLSNMFEGQTNADDSHGFADANGTAVDGHTYTYN